MTSTTFFDGLPDLVLIEVFCYLHSFDVLWGFTRLNHRLTALIVEQGFFRHVNLSQARRHQFDTVLEVLRLTNIESLAIDSDASHLQLLQWPHLPHLTSLRLQGVRDHDDVLKFVLRHAAALIHLTVESGRQFLAVSITADNH